MNRAPVVKFIKYLLEEFPKNSLFGILAMVIGALVDASSAIMVAPIFDLIMNDQGSGQDYTFFTKKVLKAFEALGLPQTTAAALSVFLMIYLLRSCIAVIAGWYDATIRARLTKVMTMNLFQSVVNADWNFFLTRNQGEFINSITRETVNLSAAFVALVSCITALVQILTFGSVALTVSWQLTLICLGIAFVSAVPLLVLSRLNYRWGHATVESAGKSNSITQESFSLAKVIQAYARQSFSVNALEEQQLIQEKLNVCYYTLAKTMQEFYYPLGLISVISGYYFSKRFNIPFAELTIILYALWKCVPYISSFLRSHGQLGQYLPSFENIRNLEQDALAHQSPKGGLSFKGIKKDIELKGVCFQYENTENMALTHLNLKVKKGEMVALVGASGSGKSTLADVIMGFHKLQEGQFKIDGVSFGDFDLNSYRNSIGYVPQQSALFNTTIRKNLLWSKENATEQEIIEACELANALEFIKKLPKGLDTEIGDRGVRLSGGQVQRLAIARAILRKPEILLLDEATSALDSESEKLIQKAIDKIAHSTTMIVVSHRLSTIRNADTICILEEGVVVEKGDYDSLLNKERGRFRIMIDQQKTH